MATRSSVIDHTLLSPTATHAQIAHLCLEADELGMASVCVNPVHVPQAAQALAHSATRVCTVIDFPLGASSPRSKAAQTRIAVQDGAQEVDMVVNLGAVTEHQWQTVTQDIRAVVEAAHQAQPGDPGEQAAVVVKVILETCLLDDGEITQSCLCAQEAGADFVKTSTGWSAAGATTHAVSVMAAAVGGRLGVKASGGIHSAQDMDAMIAAGATRIGASAGRALLDEEALS